jgi:hypothetical protein
MSCSWILTLGGRDGLSLFQAIRLFTSLARIEMTGTDNASQR